MMAFFLSYSCDICLRDSSSWKEILICWQQKKNNKSMNAHNFTTISSLQILLENISAFWKDWNLSIFQKSLKKESFLKGMNVTFTCNKKQLLVLFCTLNTLKVKKKQVPNRHHQKTNNLKKTEIFQPYYDEENMNLCAVMIVHQLKQQINVPTISQFFCVHPKYYLFSIAARARYAPLKYRTKPRKKRFFFLLQSQWVIWELLRWMVYNVQLIIDIPLFTF